MCLRCLRECFKPEPRPRGGLWGGMEKDTRPATRSHTPLSTATAVCPPGYLACRRNTSASSSSFWDEADTVASSVQEAAASSVAARGLLFSNTRPAPSRWLPLRGSSCFQPERAAAANLLKLGAAVQHLQVGGGAQVLGHPPLSSLLQRMMSYCLFR